MDDYSRCPETERDSEKYAKMVSKSEKAAKKAEKAEKTAKADKPSRKELKKQLKQLHGCEASYTEIIRQRDAEIASLSNYLEKAKHTMKQATADAEEARAIRRDISDSRHALSKQYAAAQAEVQKLTSENKDLKLELKETEKKLEASMSSVNKAISVMKRYYSSRFIVNVAFPLIQKYGPENIPTEGPFRIKFGIVNYKDKAIPYGVSVEDGGMGSDGVPKYTLRPELDNSHVHIPERGYPCGGRQVIGDTDLFNLISSLREALPNFFTPERIQQCMEEDECSSRSASVIAGIISSLIGGDYKVHSVSYSK
jgi:hypothetical protein